MLMGSMSMAYAEEPATEAATETEVISSEETSEGQTEENAASSDADTSWMTAAEDAPCSCFPSASPHSQTPRQSVCTSVFFS